MDIEDINNLIKQYPDYCPEVIGYEVGYQYVHNHCGVDPCYKCWIDTINRGVKV